jgi:hypothetical protein
MRLVTVLDRRSYALVKIKLRSVGYTESMPRIRSWTDQQLAVAVISARSYRQVLIQLKLIPAGGNYQQIKDSILRLGITTEHFTGEGWRKDLKFPDTPKADLQSLLVLGSQVQSFKLKRRLYEVGLKAPQCEICSWAERSIDGRIPVELDHINGNRYDNRIENLRVLCPNCHSLQTTHRGRNKHARLKKLT